jgi:hypothetical protein
MSPPRCVRMENAFNKSVHKCHSVIHHAHLLDPISRPPAWNRLLKQRATPLYAVDGKQCLRFSNSVTMLMPICSSSTICVYTRNGYKSQKCGAWGGKMRPETSFCTNVFLPLPRQTRSEIVVEKCCASLGWVRRCSKLSAEGEGRD